MVVRSTSETDESCVLTTKTCRGGDSIGLSCDCAWLKTEIRTVRSAVTKERVLRILITFPGNIRVGRSSPKASRSLYAAYAPNPKVVIWQVCTLKLQYPGPSKIGILIGNLHRTASDQRGKPPFPT